MVGALYIPHGSDETCLKKTNSELMKSLYIPHGSDETVSSELFTVCFICFISHMVQMKRGKKMKKYYELENFISHMVQMKPLS